MTRPFSAPRRRLCLAATALAVPAVGRGQADGPGLRVRLADGSQRRFTVDELKSLPSESASARLREGPPFPVTGVSVTTLLRLAGLDLSRNLGGGQVVGHALVARAADGYRAVWGLAAADPHFGHPPLMVNWSQADGSALAHHVGPLQLIATGESRPGRWVRQLVALEVTAL